MALRNRVPATGRGAGGGGGITGTASGTISFTGAATGTVVTTGAWEVAGASYGGVFFEVFLQTIAPVGVAFSADGTKKYIVGTNGLVFQYTLSTAWDAGTASYSGVSFSVSSQVIPLDLTFSADGTKMYIVGLTPAAVFQYSLSTAWDIGSASYSGISFSVSGQETIPHALAISADGTKMYVAGTNRVVYQYSLSTAGNVGSASYSVSFNAGGQVNSQLTALAFKPDGTRMYALDDGSDQVYQYSLSTAWDVSSASYSGSSFSVSGQQTGPSGPYGLAFKPDGSRMYVVGTSPPRVVQYDLAAATINGTASGALGLAGTATGKAIITVTASGVLGFTGATTGAVANFATANGTLAISGTATGVVGNGTANASASGALTVTGEAAGKVNVSGLAAGQFSITGNAIGTVTVAAAGSGALLLSGTATGVIGNAPAAGAAFGTLELTGTATGKVVAAAAAAGSLSITGTATGAVTASAIASGGLSISGIATGIIGTLPITGTAFGTLILGGNATANLVGMPQNTTLNLTRNTWKEITITDVTAITFQNKSTTYIYIAVTVDLVPPNNTLSALKYFPGGKETNRLLSDLFPGVPGAKRVWAFSDSSVETIIGVFTSHA